MFPAPNASLNTLQAAGNFLSNPKRSENEDKFDIRGDYTISGKDNFFARYSYGNDSNFLPSPFNNVLDGGSFQDGYSNNTAQGLAASEVHAFRNNLINEFALASITSIPIATICIPTSTSRKRSPAGSRFLEFRSKRARTLVACRRSASVMAPAIGASQFLPAVEKQNSYVFTDNLSWTRGRHALKFGAEFRFEQFTILEPAAGRGYRDFGNDLSPTIPGRLRLAPVVMPLPRFCSGFPMAARSPA